MDYINTDNKEPLSDNYKNIYNNIEKSHSWF